MNDRNSVRSKTSQDDMTTTQSDSLRTCPAYFLFLNRDHLELSPGKEFTCEVCCCCGSICLWRQVQLTFWSKRFFENNVFFLHWCCQFSQCSNSQFCLQLAQHSLNLQFCQWLVFDVKEHWTSRSFLHDSVGIATKTTDCMHVNWQWALPSWQRQMSFLACQSGLVLSKN